MLIVTTNDLEVSMAMGVPPDGWFFRRNPIEMHDDWGFPPFQETPKTVQKNQREKRSEQFQLIIRFGSALFLSFFWLLMKIDNKDVARMNWD